MNERRQGTRLGFAMQIAGALCVGAALGLLWVGKQLIGTTN